MKAAADAARTPAKVFDARLSSHEASPAHGMTNRPVVPEWSIWIIAGLALVAAIWLPFGFALGGLIEEWTELGLFAIHGPIFLVDEAGPLATFRGRPLTFAPQALAYFLDHDSFFYWHLLLVLSLLIKFLSSGSIGRFMTRSLTGGLLIGALALLYPADTMQINLRTLHIDCAIALALLAGALAVKALDVASMAARLGLGFVAAALFVTASLIYEAVLPLGLVPLLAVYVRYGLVSAIAKCVKQRAVLLMWGGALVSCIVFVVIVGQQGDSYQGSLAVGQTGGWFSKLDSWGRTIVFTALYRGFWQAWEQIYSLAWTQLSHRVVFLLVAANIALCFFLLAIREERTSDGPWTRQASPIRLLLAGIVLFVAGYSPFLVSLSHVAITQRTYLEAAFGGAMVVAALIIAFRVVLSARIVATAIAAPIVSAALLAQIYQHDQYNRTYAQFERPIVKALATATAAFRPGEPIPIVNMYGGLNGTWDLGVAVTLVTVYLLPTSGPPILCDGRTGQMLPLARPLAKTGCTIEQDNLTVVAADGKQTSYSRFAVIESDGTVTLHDNKANPPVHALRTIVPPILASGSWEPSNSWFNRARNSGLAYECKFESMWGYAVPCRTFGIYEGEWTGPATASISWVNNKDAGLIIDTLEPNMSYKMVLQLGKYALTPALDQLRLTFNGSPLQLIWTDPRRIEATIPYELVKDRTNVLGLSVPPDDKSGLSIALQHLQIWPVR
ncbi:hypothetical protein [Bradyrhizobium cenepequi]